MSAVARDSHFLVFFLEIILKQRDGGETWSLLFTVKVGDSYNLLTQVCLRAARSSSDDHLSPMG